jgi:hypothetical protein
MQDIWTNSNLTRLEPRQFIEHRSVEKIRGEFCSSQIIEPEDGKLPWNDAYKDKPAALMLVKHSCTDALTHPDDRKDPGSARYPLPPTSYVESGWYFSMPRLCVGLTI